MESMGFDSSLYGIETRRQLESSILSQVIMLKYIGWYRSGATAINFLPFKGKYKCISIWFISCFMGHRQYRLTVAEKVVLINGTGESTSRLGISSINNNLSQTRFETCSVVAVSNTDFPVRFRAIGDKSFLRTLFSR